MSCHEDRIRPSHLPAEVLSGTTIVMAGVEQESSPPRNGQSAPLTRAQLARALEENYWNVSTTARRLGISRTSVYTYMRELGMRRPGRSTEA
jgi:transcriptional regulator of acetoin/glycerol metabolism